MSAKAISSNQETHPRPCHTQSTCTHSICQEALLTRLLLHLWVSFPAFFFSFSVFFHWNGSLLNFWLSIFCQDAFLFWSLGWLKGSWFLSKTAIRKWKVAHNSCSCNSTICKAGVFETFGLWHVNVFHPKNWTQNLWKDENNHRHTNQLNLSSLPSKPYSIPLSLFLSLWLSSVSNFQPSFLSRFLQPLPD